MNTIQTLFAIYFLALFYPRGQIYATKSTMASSETADMVIVGAGELWSRDRFSRSPHFRGVMF